MSYIRKFSLFLELVLVLVVLWLGRVERLGLIFGIGRLLGMRIWAICGLQVCRLWLRRGGSRRLWAGSNAAVGGLIVVGEIHDV